MIEAHAITESERIDRSSEHWTASPTNNDYFKMGAIVAVGELYDSGRLGNKQTVAEDTRLFLESFGVRSLEDIRNLGVTGPYIEDFQTLFNL